MDAAYDAPQIPRYSEEQGRIALIDRNKRRSDTRLPMDPAEVERGKFHLKDWFLP